MTQLSKQIHLLILAVLLVCIGIAPAAAQGTFEEVSTEDKLYIRGLISKVYPDTMQISIKPAKERPQICLGSAGLDACKLSLTRR